MHSLFSSAFAGGLASFVTNPLDLAKLRIQVNLISSLTTLNYIYLLAFIYFKRCN